VALTTRSPPSTFLPQIFRSQDIPGISFLSAALQHPLQSLLGNAVITASQRVFKQVPFFFSVA